MFPFHRANYFLKYSILKLKANLGIRVKNKKPLLLAHFYTPLYIIDRSNYIFIFFVSIPVVATSEAKISKLLVRKFNENTILFLVQKCIDSFRKVIVMANFLFYLVNINFQSGITLLIYFIFLLFTVTSKSPTQTPL